MTTGVVLDIELALSYGTDVQKFCKDTGTGYPAGGIYSNNVLVDVIARRVIMPTKKVAN